VKIYKSVLPSFRVPVRLSDLLNILPTPFSAVQFHCFIYYGGSLPLLVEAVEVMFANVRDSNRY
jgi:hypothetical protein